MRKVIRELGMIVYLFPLWVIMLLIDAGLRGCKYLVGLTGWSWVISAYKSLHICGEKLSRHIRRMMPE